MAEIWEVENEGGERSDFGLVSPFHVLLFYSIFLATKNNRAPALHAFQISASTILVLLKCYQMKLSPKFTFSKSVSSFRAQFGGRSSSTSSAESLELSVETWKNISC